jgi:hypothetical protein
MADEDPKERAKEEAYVVGPGRPPKHSQFKRGASGNPKGRPKGSLSIAALIQKESLKRVPVTEGGRKKSMSKAQVVARLITNGAMKGDPKSTVLLIQELAKINDVQSVNGPEAAVPDLDIATMRRIAERVLRDVEELEAERNAHEPN